MLRACPSAALEDNTVAAIGAEQRQQLALEGDARQLLAGDDYEEVQRALHCYQAAADLRTGVPTAILNLT